MQRDIIEMNWKEFEKSALDLANQIIQSNIKLSNIWGNPRGGLPLAVRLSHLLSIPLIVNWKDEHNDNTLIVDDVVDTGNTLEPYNEPCIWRIAVLYYNPKASFQPTFFSLKKPDNSWIIFPWEQGGVVGNLYISRTEISW